MIKIEGEYNLNKSLKQMIYYYDFQKRRKEILDNLFQQRHDKELFIESFQTITPDLQPQVMSLLISRYAEMEPILQEFGLLREEKVCHECKGVYQKVLCQMSSEGDYTSYVLHLAQLHHNIFLELKMIREDIRRLEDRLGGVEKGP